MFLYLSLCLVFILFYGPVKKGNNKYASVCELLCQKSQWKQKVPLLTLRPAIFIIDSLLSFCRELQDPLPTALCSADSLRDWHALMSRDVSPQLCPHP